MLYGICTCDWIVGHVREIERLMDVLLSLKEKKDQESESASISITTMLQSLLVRTQEIGDLKLGVVQQIQDMLENKTSQLDIDEKNSGMCISFLVLLPVSSQI